MKKYIISLIALVFIIACNNEHHHTTEEHSDIYYTCSMDPQVVESKPGKCPICKMDLTPIKKSNSKGIKLSEQQEKLANIQLVPVSYGFVDSKIFATGVIKQNEQNISFINARIDGRIDKLNYKTSGSYINKGDIVYEVYSEMLSATQSELIQANKKLEQNPNDPMLQSIVNAAYSKLELWGISPKQIEQIKKQSQPKIPYPIESPYSGYVTKINVNQGAIVMEGSTLIQLTEYKTMWVEAQFYPEEIAQVKIGNEVEIMVDGVTTKLLTGKVIQVLPQVKSGTSINIIRILFTPTSVMIQPGMQANIYWHKTTDKSLVIPTNAIIQDSKGAVVWVKNELGEYESKMVHLGEVSGSRAAVLHGLKEGEQLVVSGTYLLNSEYVFRKGNNPMEGHDMSKM